MHGIRYFTEPKTNWIQRWLSWMKRFKEINQSQTNVGLSKSWQKKKIENRLWCTENSIYWFFFRVWWAIALISSMVLCIVAILSVWTRWRNHPVIMNIDDKIRSIGTIPFPAITICPTQKFIEEKVNFLKFYAELKLYDDIHKINSHFSQEE